MTVTQPAKADNDLDGQVDIEIAACLTPTSPRSFFLFAGAGSGKTRSLAGGDESADLYCAPTTYSASISCFSNCVISASTSEAASPAVGLSPMSVRDVANAVPM